VIRGNQSSSSQLFTEIAIKECVIVMPHLVTPSKHPHPTASRHSLLSCISSWLLVMFFAVCDTEAVGGLPFLSPSLPFCYPAPITNAAPMTQPAFFHLTPHTHKQTNSYTNNSLDTCKAHAHSHPSLPHTQIHANAIKTHT